MFRFRARPTVSEATKENLVNFRQFSRFKLGFEASILVKGGKTTGETIAVIFEGSLNDRYPSVNIRNICTSFPEMSLISRCSTTSKIESINGIKLNFGFG
jgi:hypothetical protein